MWTVLLIGTVSLIGNVSAFSLLPRHTRCLVKAFTSSVRNEEWNDFLSDDENKQIEIPKLGIDIRLNPLTQQEAADLKAEVSEMVSEKIAAGIDDIQKLRKNLNRELEAAQRALQMKSEFRAEQESAKLMNKIDQLTGNFMSETKSVRESTKLAAAADRAMEGKAAEIGTWGEVRGASVLLSSSNDVLLLGSVAASQKTGKSTVSSSSEKVLPPNENRILIVADTTQDPLAKALIPALGEVLKKALPDLDIQELKPTATMPLGGDNAACVLLFITSLSDRSSVNNILDRLLRKTMQGDGTIGSPPTQIVAVSTLGTTRTNKLPYSMQNLMGGGKLSQRQQMEEAIIALIQNRAAEPSLDYTICKFGEISDAGKNVEFQLFPGDVLDETTSVAVASQVLAQAIAYQPAARNATLCAVGVTPPSEQETDVWEDAFLRLDGPEILRQEKVATKNLDEAYGRLVEYVREWAVLLSESKKGLTTPIQAFLPTSSSRPSGLVTKRDRVQLLFLPTQTGKNYKSRDEEIADENDTATGKSKASTIPTRPGKMAREGGVEIIVERTSGDEIRIRVKRCNYASDAAIKELSEDTILSRLRDAITVWKRDQHQP